MPIQQPTLPDSKVLQTPLINGKNSVSALYELCQAYHLPQPTVVEDRPEESLDPTLHYCAFKVGEEQYSMGAGRSKKAAKEIAASMPWCLCWSSGECNSFTQEHRLMGTDLRY